MSLAMADRPTARQNNPIRRARPNTQLLQIIMLAFVMFSATFRDDAAAIADSEWWSGLTRHAIVAAAKQYSIYFLAAGGILLLIYILLHRAIIVSLTSNILIFFSMAVYATIRTSISDPELALKLAAGMMMQFALFLTLSNTKNWLDLNSVINRVWTAAFCMAIILLLANSFNILTGNGYVPGNARLFGTSAHPNFLGVQLALLNLFVFARGMESKGLPHVVSLVILIGLSYLLFKTGSRTGILVLLIGAASYLWSRARFSVVYSFSMGFAILAFIAAVWFILYGLQVNGDAGALGMFSRGNNQVDTRSEAWLTLIEQIGENFWFGQGAFSITSENSFLRGWAAFGILYALMFLALTIKNVMSAIHLCYTSKCNAQSCLMFSVTAALIVGSILEGYLTEILGLPVLLWFCVTAIVGEDRRPMRTRR